MPNFSIFDFFLEAIVARVIAFTFKNTRQEFIQNHIGMRQLTRINSGGIYRHRNTSLVCVTFNTQIKKTASIIEDLNSSSFHTILLQSSYINHDTKKHAKCQAYAKFCSLLIILRASGSSDIDGLKVPM
jgi:hypothetical protein